MENVCIKCLHNSVCAIKSKTMVGCQDLLETPTPQPTEGEEFKKQAIVEAKKFSPEPGPYAFIKGVDWATANNQSQLATHKGLVGAVEKYLKHYNKDCLLIQCKHCSFMTDCNKTERYLLQQALGREEGKG